MVAVCLDHYCHIYDKGGNADSDTGSDGRSAVIKMPPAGNKLSLRKNSCIYLDGTCVNSMCAPLGSCAIQAI